MTRQITNMWYDDMHLIHEYQSCYFWPCFSWYFFQPWLFCPNDKEPGVDFVFPTVPSHPLHIHYSLMQRTQVTSILEYKRQEVSSSRVFRSKSCFFFMNLEWHTLCVGWQWISFMFLRFGCNMWHCRVYHCIVYHLKKMLATHHLDRNRIWHDGRNVHGIENFPELTKLKNHNITSNM